MNPGNTNQGIVPFLFRFAFFLAGYCSLGCLSISEGTAEWKDQKAEGAAEGAARARRDEKTPVTDDDNSRVSPATGRECCSQQDLRKKTALLEADKTKWEKNW